MEPTRYPVLFGEVLFDCFDNDSRVLGGAPFNVAWHLQGFGAKPLFISRIGDDRPGQEVRATMTAWGMNTAGLQSDPEHPTGEVRVSLQGGQPSFDIVPDRAYDYITAAALPGELSPALVYHGSLALRQATSAAALEALVDRHGAPIFLDINLRSPWWERSQLLQLLERARWLKINDEELNLVMDVDGRDLVEKAQKLQQKYQIERAIVTQGSAGAFVLDESGDIHRVAPSDRVEVVDTVGAGDAFAAVCVLGLLEDWPMPVTLERAQKLASLVVGRRGAIIDDRSCYETLLAAW